MPSKFGMIAVLQGDLDTSDGVGKVFFRQDSSPEVLSRAAEHMNRAFPEDDEVSPTHAVIVTWADVAPHEPESRGDSLGRKVSIRGCFLTDVYSKHVCRDGKHRKRTSMNGLF